MCWRNIRETLKGMTSGSFVRLASVRRAYNGLTSAMFVLWITMIWHVFLACEFWYQMKDRESKVTFSTWKLIEKSKKISNLFIDINYLLDSSMCYCFNFNCNMNVFDMEIVLWVLILWSLYYNMLRIIVMIYHAWCALKRTLTGFARCEISFLIVGILIKIIKSCA